MKIILKLSFFLFFFAVISCLSSPDAKYENANILRNKILKYDLARYTENEYNEARKKYEIINKLLEEKKNRQADKLLNELTAEYEAIIEKALPAYTDDKAKEIGTEQSDCLEIKANVAMKDKYDEAEKLYKEALSYKKAGQYEKAIDTFNRSSELFREIKKITEEKKARTENSFELTKEALFEFEENTNEMQTRIDNINKELEETLKAEGLK